MLDEPFRSQVQEAFALSISVIWKVMIGIAGVGFLASLTMKGLPLHTEIDRKWGLKDGMMSTDGADKTEEGIK